MFLSQIESIIDNSLPNISNLSNILSILYHSNPNINWCGLYLYDSTSRFCYLGPFLGLPACTRIQIGEGVVGTCAFKEEALYVSNVHEFKGHIACDSASKSEICIPLFNKNNKLLGVLDIDSNQYDNFSFDQVKQYQQAAQRLSQFIPEML